MTTKQKAAKQKAIKLSFHIPANEHHIFELIKLVSDVTGQTPSHWVYSAVIKKLTEAGLVDAKHQIIQSQYDALQAALPPGAERKKTNVKNRSTKSS